MDTKLTDARKGEYARLVAKAVGKGVKPSQVKLTRFMQSGAWSAVLTSTPRADRGVIFFEAVDGRKRFKEAWGGWADPSEKPELVSWAKKLGVPDDLAQCFASIVTE